MSSLFSHFNIPINAHISKLRRLNWQNYQLEVTERIQVYEGDYISIQKAFISTKLSQDGWNRLESKYCFNTVDNLMYRVIEEVTKVYSKPAKRAFINPEEETEEAEAEETEENEITKEDEVYNDIIENSGIDVFMDGVCKYMQVTGIVLVRPRVDGDTITYQAILPDHFVPFMDKKNPTKMNGVYYEIFFADDIINVDLSPTSFVNRRRFLWDMIGDKINSFFNTDDLMPGFIEIDKDHQIVDSMVGNDYPYVVDDEFIMPIAMFRIDAPPNMLVNRSVGTDLFDATMLAGKASVEKQWVQTNQSHKQITLSGPGASKQANKFLDPTSPIILEGDSKEASIGLLDLRTDVKNYEDHINSLVEKVTTRRGSSLNEFKKSAQQQTAEAQRIQRSGKEAYNRKLQNSMRDGETELANHLRLIWNHHARGVTGKISDNAKFNLDFGDPFEYDPYANHQEKMERIKSNIISVVDITLDHNTDLESREDALKAIERNKEENRLARDVSGFALEVEQEAPLPNPEGEVAPTEVIEEEVAL